MLNENKVNAFRKLLGRVGVIRSNFTGHNIPPKTLIMVEKVDAEKERFLVSFKNSSNKRDLDYVGYEDLNFKDENIDVRSVIMKGVRNERGDNYKGQPILELMDDEKSIYLSAALRSIMMVSPGDKVGFCIDTDTKMMMVFKCKNDSEGFEVAGNGRIKSSADWRDLKNTYDTLITIIPEPYVDSDNFPGYLFYNLSTYYKAKKEKDIKREPGLLESEEVNNFEQVISSIRRTSTTVPQYIVQ